MRVIKTFEGIKDNFNINVKIADDDATIKFQRIWSNLEYFKSMFMARTKIQI